MKKQTAIDWLIEQMPLGIRKTLSENGIDFQKAKVMEKEQIKDAYFNSASDILCIPNGIKENAEKYYNETYEN